MKTEITLNRKAVTELEAVIRATVYRSRVAFVRARSFDNKRENLRILPFEGNALRTYVRDRPLVVRSALARVRFT